jgi:hypothetical protein
MQNCWRASGGSEQIYVKYKLWDRIYEECPTLTQLPFPLAHAMQASNIKPCIQSWKMYGKSRFSCAQIEVWGGGAMGACAPPPLFLKVKKVPFFLG